jgi:hypothetical protein
MPSGIKGWISQHGNPDELNSVQNLKPELVGFIAPAGNDGIIGTDHVAHGAPDTFVSWIGFLANTVI